MKIPPLFYSLFGVVVCLLALSVPMPATAAGEDWKPIDAAELALKSPMVEKEADAIKKRYAQIGEVVVFSVQTAEPRKAVKKKDILHGVVVRQRQAFRRKDGSYIRFDDNAVVVLDWGNKDKKEPKAGRIFGPIPRELQELGYQTIISRAPEVV